jgi:translation initiation factor 2 beta subunit (eIF-2beta)/eIF-5
MGLWSTLAKTIETVTPIRFEDEPYKHCPVCGKRIWGVTRSVRDKCEKCGHRVCNRHMKENGVCRKCEP